MGSAIVDNRCNNYDGNDDDDDFTNAFGTFNRFFIEHHNESTGVSGNKFLFPVIGIRFWKRDDLRKSVSFQVRNWEGGRSRKKVFSRFTRVGRLVVRESLYLLQLQNPSATLFFTLYYLVYVPQFITPSSCCTYHPYTYNGCTHPLFLGSAAFGLLIPIMGLPANSGCCRPFINRLIVVFGF